ncbi:MAG: hypothetical protein RLZZ157_685, partial [Pseudomonadota bacterium]
FMDKDGPKSYCWVPIMSIEALIVRPSDSVAPHDRAERILTEATRLFSENGYAGTRMSDIAAAIGVTKPIVYRHFQSKQALFEALVKRVLSDQILGACQMIDNHSGPTRPLLEGLLRDARRALDVPGALAPWRIAVGESDRFPDLAAFLKQGFIEPILATMERLFQRALDRKELVRADARTLAHLFCSPFATVAMILATFGDAEDDFIAPEPFLSAHLDSFWRAWSV